MAVTVKGNTISFLPFEVVCAKCQCVLNVGEQKDMELSWGSMGHSIIVVCPNCGSWVRIPEELQKKYEPLFAKEIEENLSRR